MAYPNHQEWLEKISSRQAVKLGELSLSAGDHPQDTSLPIFNDLLSMGYTEVIWNASNSNHAECKNLHDQKWSLQDFISGTEYDAPIFSRTHPGDRSCFVIVTGENLDPCQVGPWPFVE